MPSPVLAVSTVPEDNSGLFPHRQRQLTAVMKAALRCDSDDGRQREDGSTWLREIL
jgi:hypothetical protein